MSGTTDADLIELQDKSRVRNRMAMDMGSLERSLRSELENYGEYFTAGEEILIKAILLNAKSLAKAINGD